MAKTNEDGGKKVPAWVKPTKPTQPQSTTPAAPKWNRPGSGKKRDEEPTRYDPAGAGGYDPSKAQPPAWQNPYAPMGYQNNLGMYNGPYNGFQTPTTGTGSGMINPFRGANAGAGAKSDQQRTALVRTGEGTYQQIPWQEGMLTGTFFSGGTVAPGTVSPFANTYNDMRGRSTNRNKGFMVTPPTTPQKPYIPPGNESGGGGGYGGGGGKGGGGGGGGGGGYSPSAKTPSWLLNLYNWNYKG